MRLVRLAAAAAAGAIVAACGAAAAAAPATHALAAEADPAVVTAVAPVLHHRAIHSKADARAVANQALSLVAFPPGAAALTVRPAAGLASAGGGGGGGEGAGVPTQLTLTRWEAVPGTVTDASAWVVAHAAAGTDIYSGGDGVELEWTSAPPFHELPFSLSAWLATDGDHVDVTFSANVVWTPAKTAVETIPATVHFALLDYNEGNFTFGASSRHVVTGKDLARLRAGVNALDTAVAGESCGPNLDASVTLTMSYGGHRVVMQTDKCEHLSVVSDGHAQPALSGSLPYPITARLIASATPAPVQDVAPGALLRDLSSKAAAQQRAQALAQLIALPRAARRVATTGAPYASPKVAVASRSVAWTGSMAGAVDYLSTHVPHGFVLAHAGPTPAGTTTVVLQPAHVYPASSLISVQVSRHGPSTVLRIDGEATWVTPRSKLELIPESTATARVTILPVQRPSKRVLLTGKAVQALTHALNSRKPARPLLACPPGPAGQALKLEVHYVVGKHVVTFFWYDSDCVLGVLVDGHRATGLLDPPTALVERLLHWT